MGGNYAVLIEQGEAALCFEHALNHEHHIRTARIIFIKDKGNRMLQRPREQPFTELSNLLAIFQDNRVFPDEVDTADMAIEVNPHHGPVEPCGDLFDMGGLTGSVITLHHDAAVMCEACANGLGGFIIKEIGLINRRYILGCFAKGRNLHIEIDIKDFTRRDHNVGFKNRKLVTHVVCP